MTGIGRSPPEDPWALVRSGRTILRLRAMTVLAVVCAVTVSRAQTSIDDESACAAVASRGSRYSDYEPLRVPLPPIDEASEEQVERILGGRRYGDPDPGTTHVWHLDIDADGVDDHFAIDYGNNTMHLGRGYFLSGVTGSAIRDFDAYWDGGGALDLWLIAVAEKFYVVSSTSRDQFVDLDRLWRVAADGTFRAVCEFGSTENTLELVEGLDDSFCEAVAEDRVPRAQYNVVHTVRLPRNEELFWSKYPKDGLARIDIDNDGNAENIIRVDFLNSGGRGCGAQYLAVTDDSRASIEKTPLNELLLDRLGGFPCGPNLDVLVDNGVAYIDAQGALDRNVFRIRGLETEKICGFRGRVAHTYRLLSLAAPKESE